MNIAELQKFCKDFDIELTKQVTHIIIDLTFKQDVIELHRVKTLRQSATLMYDAFKVRRI